MLKRSQKRRYVERLLIAAGVELTDGTILSDRIILQAQ